MFRYSIAAAALLVVAGTNVASATTLTKAGRLFAADGSVTSSCVLGDGSRLELAGDEIQSGVDETWLEHRDADGGLVTPPLLLVVGSISYRSLDCSPGGEAIVSWASEGNNDPCLHYRFIAPDHRSAGEVREFSLDGVCGAFPRFASWPDGYATVWVDTHTSESFVMLQAFRRDGSPRFAPIAVSATPTNWHGWPGLGSDREGNTLVSWEEGAATYREIVAVAVSADGETSGAPLVGLRGSSDLIGNGPDLVVARDVGTFVASWYGWSTGGRIAQRMRIEEFALEPTTTTSTTSTTMEDDATPDFGRDRGWGREENRQSIDPSLAGDGHGGWLAMWSGARPCPSPPANPLPKTAGWRTTNLDSPTMPARGWRCGAASLTRNPTATRSARRASPSPIQAAAMANSTTSTSATTAIASTVTVATATATRPPATTAS